MIPENVNTLQIVKAYELALINISLDNSYLRQTVILLYENDFLRNLQNVNIVDTSTIF